MLLLSLCNINTNFNSNLDFDHQRAVGTHSQEKPCLKTAKIVFPASCIMHLCFPDVKLAAKVHATHNV